MQGLFLLSDVDKTFSFLFLLFSSCTNVVVFHLHPQYDLRTTSICHGPVGKGKHHQAKVQTYSHGGISIRDVVVYLGGDVDKWARDRESGRATLVKLPPSVVFLIGR